MGIKERKIREKEHRRRQIMTAARKVFSEKNFNAATMGDIAGEAEISPATIYLYFRNKEELFASLALDVLKYMSIKLAYVKNVTNQNLDHKIKALMEALYEVYEFDPLVLMNLFHLQSSETLNHLSPNLMSDIKKLAAESFKSMVNIFEEGKKRGDFIKKKSIALADIVWALFAGIVLWEESKRLLDNQKDYLRSTLELAFEIFRRGIKVYPEPE